MIAVLSAAAVASLIGSGHCVAMCGALAMVAEQGGRARLQIWFHAGRITVYALLGAIAGAVGHGLDSLGELAGLERVASIVATLVAVVAVVGRVTAAPALALAGPRALMMRLLRRVTSAPMRAWLIGIATAFVPCGWLYLWVASAAATGGVLEGGAVMAVFGLGAVPVFFGATRIASWLHRGPLARYPRFVAASAIALLLGTVALRSVSVAHLHQAFASGAGSAAAPIVCHAGVP